jgi:hypothetical protein
MGHPTYSFFSPVAHLTLSQTADIEPAAKARQLATA